MPPPGRAKVCVNSILPNPTCWINKKGNFYTSFRAINYMGQIINVKMNSLLFKTISFKNLQGISRILQTQLIPTDKFLYS
uniref:Putative ovule protein n=1 Tax=Solanum chacoense TaxID=4108 RepID=A0A0V0H4B9_SOLCH